ADLDPLDLIGRALDTRVERRRPVDLRALRDLDLLTEGDAPMPGEVKRERPRRRAGRRILGNAAAGNEHPRLPAPAGAGDAVDAEHFAEVEDARQVRPQRRHLVLRAEADVDVLEAVVVDLDRQFRAL